MQIIRLLISFRLLIATQEQVHLLGRTKLTDHCAVDLGKGSGECSVVLDGSSKEFLTYPRMDGDDFRLEPGAGQRLYMRSRHGARFALSTSAPSGLNGCVTKIYDQDQMRVDNLAVGACVCILTHEGRYAELKFEHPRSSSSDLLIVDYTTWDR